MSAKLLSKLFLLALFAVPVAAQQPKPDCSADVSSAVAIEKSHAIADRIEAKANAALLEQEIARQKGQVAATTQRLGVEQGTSAKLAASNVSAQQKIAGLEKALADAQQANAILTSERDAARKEAKHNRSWKTSFKRVFGIVNK